MAISRSFKSFSYLVRSNFARCVRCCGVGQVLPPHRKNKKNDLTCFASGLRPPFKPPSRPPTTHDSSEWLACRNATWLRRRRVGERGGDNDDIVDEHASVTRGPGMWVVPALKPFEDLFPRPPSLPRHRRPTATLIFHPCRNPLAQIYASSQFAPSPSWHFNSIGDFSAVPDN